MKAKGVQQFAVWLLGAFVLSLMNLGALPVQAAPGLVADVVSVTPAPTVKSGETAPITVVLKNTGTATWQNVGINATKLATAGPRDRQSGFYAAGWIAPNRVVSAEESAVAPGQNGTFRFNATGNGLGGAVTEKFGLVTEGVEWATLTFPITLNVAKATYKADLLSPASVSAELKAGQAQTFETRIRNSGDTTWQSLGGSAVKLATTSPMDRKSVVKATTWLSDNRVASIGSVTQAGSEAIISWTIQAPAKPGNYKEEFGVVVEGIAWLAPRVTLNLKVVPAIYQAQWVQQSSSVSVEPAGTASVWVEFKNTGNTAWAAEGATPTRLGTSRRLDRGSSFYDASWITPNRAAAMSPAVVNPGEVARFTFNLNAPDKVGKYREYFQPVVDGVAWLNDVGLYWDIAVEEELSIQNLIRVGLTATTDPVTISGGPFVVRRGTDKSLVRKVDSSITITPVGGGYALSTGETVNDFVRIVPMKGAILNVQTGGMGGTYTAFRGIIVIQRSAINNVWVVNHVELEDYMQGIAEVPEGWPQQAQMAQMTAARTYAVKQRSHSAAVDIFDLYDDTRSQVYYGYNYEKSRPNLVAAAQATKGMVIKHGGQPINAYYFSDSWGSTEASYNVWGKGNPALSIPYLQAVTDPYSRASDWNYTLTQDYLKTRFDTTLGIAATGSDDIKSIEVTERFSSNHAKMVRFTMVSGRTINVPSWDFDYYTNNNDIRSMAFNIVATGDPARPDFLFTGKGWGHGVGMAQWGARNMADQGFDYKRILTYYYTGTAVEPL